ncbi:MAG: hypothetical protein DMD37_08760, partial [Gemmatimonadetes bacterium]
NGPRFMALAPDGSVYVALTGAGQVVRLLDLNNDGVAESRTVVLTGLLGPHGIAFRGDTLYVAEENGVKRYDPGVATPVQLVSNLPIGGHSTRSIAFSPDGLYMYVSIGSSSNIDPETDTLRAAVMRYNLNGTGGRVFARGLRNSVGIAINPTTGALWATNNDRDNIGPTTAATDSLPPERINILLDGKNYGWPQCYLPNRPNPEYASADCSTVTAPAITFTAHSAPLGIAFYTGTMFPAGYQGDAFVAYHGSWNRSVPTGAKVVRVHVQGGVPVSITDFVVGWQLEPSGSRWGRPAGLLVLPDGSLLITDDSSGRIWRVSYGP